MSENSMKGTLIKRASPLDAVAIESPMTGLGIPDVNYVCGWIECKALKAWPKGADTNPVKFPHPWTKEQQVWGYRRGEARRRQSGLLQSQYVVVLLLCNHVESE